MLRAAFASTMKDPDFLKEAAALGLDVDPMSAEDTARIVHDVIHTSPAIVTKTRALMKLQK